MYFGDMGSVVRKKKNSLFVRILDKVKAKSLQIEREDPNCDITLSDIRTDSGDLVIIASRRDELRAAKYGNSDAVIIFDGNS